MLVEDRQLTRVELRVHLSYVSLKRGKFRLKSANSIYHLTHLLISIMHIRKRPNLNETNIL